MVRRKSLLNSSKLFLMGRQSEFTRYNTKSNVRIQADGDCNSIIDVSCR